MKKILPALIIFGVGGVAIAANFLSPSHLFNQSNLLPIGSQPVQAQSTKPTVQQTKPTVVKIYADWCPACQTLKPIVTSLQKRYQNQANFVIFDVTNRTTTQASLAKARELGLENFFNSHKSQTATIAVINPHTKQATQTFRKNFDTQAYVKAIDSAIAQAKTNQ